MALQAQSFLKEVSYNYNLDLVREYLKDAGKSDDDEALANFINNNSENPKFIRKFQVTNAVRDERIDEIAEEYLARGRGKLDKSIPDIFLPPALQGATAFKKMTAQIGELFMGDLGVEDLDLGTALSKSRQITEDAVDEERGLTRESEGILNSMWQGFKSIDKSGLGFLADSEVASTLNMLIDPNSETYDERVGKLFGDKYINYVQDGWDAVAEGTGNILGELIYFQAAAGLTAGASAKAINFGIKMFNRGKDLKNATPFVQALRTIQEAKKTGIFKSNVDLFKKVGWEFGLDKYVRGRIGAEVLTHTVDDVLMFSAHSVMSGENPFRGAASGLAFGISGTAAKVVGNTLGKIIGGAAGTSYLRALTGKAVNRITQVGVSGGNFALGMGLIGLAERKPLSTEELWREFGKGAMLNAVLGTSKRMYWELTNKVKTGTFPVAEEIRDVTGRIKSKITLKNTLKNLKKHQSATEELLDTINDDPKLQEILRRDNKEWEMLSIKDWGEAESTKPKNGTRKEAPPTDDIAPAPKLQDRYESKVVEYKGKMDKGVLENYEKDVTVPISRMEYLEHKFYADVGKTRTKELSELDYKDYDQQVKGLKSTMRELYKDKDKRDDYNQIKQRLLIFEDNLKLQKRITGFEKGIPISTDDKIKSIEDQLDRDESNPVFHEFLTELEILRGRGVIGVKNYHEIAEQYHSSLPEQFKSAVFNKHIKIKKTGEVELDVKAMEREANLAHGEYKLSVFEADQFAKLRKVGEMGIVVEELEKEAEKMDVGERLDRIKSMGEQLNEKYHLTPELKSEYKSIVSSSSTSEEINRTYAILKATIENINSVSTARTIRDIKRKFSTKYDTDPEQRHSGYDKFFNELAKKFSELEIKSPDKMVSAFNQTLIFANESQHETDFREKLLEYSKKAEDLQPIFERLSSEEMKQTTNAIFAHIKSAIVYGGNNLNLITIDENYGLVPITKSNPNKIGELNSFVNEIWGSEVLKMQSGTHDNKGKDILNMDFAAMAKGERTAFVERMAILGHYFIFSKGSTAPMIYFTQEPEMFKEILKREGDSVGNFKEFLKSEITEEIVKDLEAEYKNSDFKDELQYWKFAANSHIRLKELLGDGYRVHKELIGIEDINKRFQIAGAQGLSLRMGQYAGVQYDLPDRKTEAEKIPTWSARNKEPMAVKWGESFRGHAEMAIEVAEKIKELEVKHESLLTTYKETREPATEKEIQNLSHVISLYNKAYGAMTNGESYQKEISDFYKEKDKLTGIIIADRESWKLDGRTQEETSLLETDGGTFLHPKVFDRFVELFGYRDGKFLKGFLHELDITKGAIGFKGGLFKATPEQVKFMEKEGLDWVGFESAFKYRGSRELNEKIDLHADKFKMLFEDHNPFKGEDGKVKRAYKKLDKQLMNNVTIDRNDPLSTAAFSQLKEVFDKHAEKITENWTRDFNDIDKLGRIVANYIDGKGKAETMEEASREFHSDLVEASNIKTPTERALLSFGINSFTMNLPFAKDYVKAALKNKFFSEISQPEVLGFSSVLRPSSQYRDKLTDDNFMLGEECRDMSIQMYEKDYQTSTLGDIWDTIEMIKGHKLKDNVPLNKQKISGVTIPDEHLMHRTPAELKDGLKFIMNRPPISNPSGTRALEFGGFGGKGTGTQVMLNPYNTEKSSGSDFDGDKMSIFSANKYSKMSKSFEYFQRHKDWASEKSGFPTIPERIEERAKRDVALSTDESKYNIDKMVESVKRNIDGKKVLERVAGLMKREKIAFAQEIDYNTDLRTKKANPKSILGSKHRPTGKPYIVGLVGTRDIEKLSGVEINANGDKYDKNTYDAIKEFFTKTLDRAVKVNPDMVLAVGMGRGVDEVAAEVAIELGIPIRAVVPIGEIGTQKNSRDNNGMRNAAVEYDKIIGSISAENIHKVKGGLEERNAALVRLSNEMWSYDVEDKAFKHSTPSKTAIEKTTQAGKIHVDLIGESLNNAFKGSEKREKMDHTFDFWVNYAADSQKYGGMPPWEQVQAEIFGELFGVTDKMNKWLFGNRMAYQDSKVGLIANALNAMEKGIDKETGKSLKGSQIIKILKDYKRAFPESATLFENALHKIVNTDISLLRHVDMAKKQKLVHDKFDLPEGAIRYQYFLNKNGYAADEEIAYKSMDRDMIGEITEFLGLYHPVNENKYHNKISALGKTMKIDEMDKPFKTKEAFQAHEKAMLPRMVSFLSENKGIYRSMLTDLKETADGMMFKDIHAWSSAKPREDYQEAILKSYGHNKKGYAIIRDIDNTVAALRILWAEVADPKTKLTKMQREEAMENLKQKVLENARVHSKVQSDYYYWRFIDAIGGYIGNKKGQRFSSDLPKLLFKMDFLPVDILREYGDAARKSVKQLTSVGTTPPESILLAATDPFGIGAVVSLGKSIKQSNSERIKDYSDKLSSGRRKVGEDYIDDFIRTKYDKIPLVVKKFESPKDFIEDVIGRSWESLKKTPINEREMQQMIEMAKLAEKGKELVEKPTGELAKKYHEFRSDMIDKFFLPEKVLNKTYAGRKGIREISNTVHDSEYILHYMKTIKDDIMTLLNDDLNFRSKDKSKTPEKHRENIHRDFKRILETTDKRQRRDFYLAASDNIQQGVDAWMAKNPNLNDKNIIDFAHDILKQTRKIKNEILPRIILNKAKSRKWGANFLSLPQKYVDELSELEYQALLGHNIYGRYDNPKMGIMNNVKEVGKIKGYYPRLGVMDIDAMKDAAKKIAQEDEVWHRLHDEGGISAIELNAILQRVGESGRSKERTEEITDEIPDVDRDVTNYLESIIRPFTRMKILRSGQNMIEEMIKAKETEPEHAEFIKKMTTYMEDLVNHTMGGSRSKDFSLYEDMMDGMQNLSFGTLIGLNIASAQRNRVQKILAIMDTGWWGETGWKKSSEWRRGEGSAAFISHKKGKGIRTFNEVKREFGIQYGLTNQAMNDQMELYVSQAIKEAKIDVRIDEVRELIDRTKISYDGGEIDISQRDNAIKKFEKSITSYEKTKKIMAKSGKVVDLTRQFATITGERGVLGVKSLSFKGIEEVNRLNTAAAGYYRSYKKAEADYKRNIDIYGSYKNADEYAHEKGLEGARALVKLTQFEYHSFNAPKAMRSPGQKAFFQFRSYTWNWTNMMAEYIHKGYLAGRYGGDSANIKRLLRTMALIGTFSVLDELYLKGINNAWQAEPVDKAITLAELMMGDDDAAWGKGWAGFLESFPGASFQPIMDVAMAGVVGATGSNPFTGTEDGWNYHLKRKYGVLAGETHLPYILGSFYAGVTPSRLLYEYGKDRRKSHIEILAKTAAGISSRWDYQKRGKRRIAKF